MIFRSLRLKALIRKTLLLSLLSPVSLLASLPEQQCSLPMTSDEVAQFLAQAQNNAIEKIQYLTSLPSDQMTPENTMRPWGRLSNEILESFSVLSFIKYTNFPSKMDAEQAIDSFKGFLYQSIVMNPDLFRSLMTYVKTSLDKPLNPYERYEIQNLLSSCDKISDQLSPENQEMLAQLKALNNQFERTPFLSLISDTPPKTSSQTDFTVLTLNTCFVPGKYPYLFGGAILPWQMRFDPLVEKIISIDADVVCLQEIHPEDASYALYEALKDNYTYFYGKIGPRTLGFSLETLGAPSGLFIASKLPIENPEFTQFSAIGLEMNFGFFDFVVTNGTQAIGHIYTTHMHALQQYADIRALQLEQIVAKMEDDYDESIPMFLCGDLNISYGKEEPSDSLLKTYFYSDFNKDQLPVSADNRTCTNYLTNYLFSPTKNPADIDPEFQILDYALLLQTESYGIKTNLIPMNDLSEPMDAISDHHGLLTRIEIQEGE